MRKISKLLEVFFIFFLILLCFSCQNPVIKPRSLKGTERKSSENTKKEALGMDNPIMMSAGGADIGRLFNGYYRTGQIDKMIPLLDKKTKQTYSKEQLQMQLKKLDFGFDMKLSGSKQEGNEFIINYTCVIAQTKVIKQLKVILENDTARIIPSNLKKGLIFQ